MRRKIEQFCSVLLRFCQLFLLLVDSISKERNQAILEKTKTNDPRKTKTNNPRKTKNQS
jgi:hypothetical protein